uniref:Zinc finger, CCHC-type n=1 Tax=Tanacetum cinerariifolium TaxID=118510 RepID=A0A699GS13_TANCI|nr:zinc finger, CCHC-type [Tanacetum cinerariifolium]
MSDSLFDSYQNVKSSKNYRTLWRLNIWLKIHQKDFKHTLKHKKEEFTLVELGSHLCIKESLGIQDSDKPKGNNVAGPSVVNMVEHNNFSRHNDHRGKRKYHDSKTDPNKKSKVTCWKCGKPRHLKKNCKGGRVGNKDNGSGTNGLGDGYSNSLKGQHMFNKSFYVYYVTYVSEAYYVQYDDVACDQCDLHATASLENKKYFVMFIDDASRDAIFDENRFSSVFRPSQRFLVKGTKEFSGLVVTDEDVAFWKETINDEIDSIMGNNTWVLADLPRGILSSRFSMKDMRKADAILDIRIKHGMSTPMDTSEKLMPNNSQAVSQLEYSRVIGFLMYVMTCIRLDIAFVMGKLSRYTSNLVLEGYIDASWISNTKENSSTSGWVFLLGGGLIS